MFQLDDRDHDRVEGDPPEVEVVGHEPRHVEPVAEEDQNHDQAEHDPEDPARDGEHDPLDVDHKPRLPAVQPHGAEQSQLPLPVQHRDEDRVEDGQGHDGEEDDVEGPVAPVVQLERRVKVRRGYRPSHHFDPGLAGGGLRPFEHRVGVR